MCVAVSRPVHDPAFGVPGSGLARAMLTLITHPCLRMIDPARPSAHVGKGTASWLSSAPRLAVVLPSCNGQFRACARLPTTDSHKCLRRPPWPSLIIPSVNLISNMMPYSTSVIHSRGNNCPARRRLPCLARKEKETAPVFFFQLLSIPLVKISRGRWENLKIQIGETSKHTT